MGWFKWKEPKAVFSVCAECGVHFEPVSGSEEPWGNLCKTHRAPVMQKHYRQQTVVNWAKRNWERLYDEATKEEAAKQMTNISGLQGMAQAQQSNAWNHSHSVLGGFQIY